MQSVVRICVIVWLSDVGEAVYFVFFFLLRFRVRSSSRRLFRYVCNPIKFAILTFFLLVRGSSCGITVVKEYKAKHIILAISRFFCFSADDGIRTSVNFIGILWMTDVLAGVCTMLIHPNPLSTFGRFILSTLYGQILQVDVSIMLCTCFFCCISRCF